jgi:heat shock protein HslJ
MYWVLSLHPGNAYKTYNMTKLVFTTLALTLLTSFAPHTGIQNQPSLYNTKWILINHFPAGGHKDLPFKKAFIKFNAEKKSAGGNGGCNAFGGSLLVSGETLSITGISSTLMYCVGVQEYEDSFFSLLQKVNRFEINDKKLFLYRDKSLLLVFESE